MGLTPEGAVKSYLKSECERRGWSCLALEYPYKPGWPDRAIFMLDGRMAFVETKASSTKHSKKHITDQKNCLRWLHTQGIFAGFAVGRKGVDWCIRMIERNSILKKYEAYTGLQTFDEV